MLSVFLVLASVPSFGGYSSYIPVSLYSWKSEELFFLLFWLIIGVWSYMWLPLATSFSLLV